MGEVFRVCGGDLDFWLGSRVVLGFKDTSLGCFAGPFRGMSFTLRSDGSDSSVVSLVVLFFVIKYFLFFWPRAKSLFP